MITRESLNLQTPYEPPAGNLEGLIARIFAEVFELDQIGAADEFFDVGGDSLLGEILSEQISRQTGHDLKISNLFEHGSPREIARFLSEKSSQPAKRAGERPPIFLIHGRVGFTLPKPDFRKVFGEDQEFHLFDLPGIGPSFSLRCRATSRASSTDRSKFSLRLSGNWTTPWPTCCRGGVPGSCLKNMARSARPRRRT